MRRKDWQEAAIRLREEQPGLAASSIGLELELAGYGALTGREVAELFKSLARDQERLGAMGTEGQ